MPYLFSNNAFSFLTGDLDAVAQDITVRGADAILFPQPDQARGDVFMVTIEDRARNTIEICECFRRVGATLSVRRGREGTAPRVHLSGATVSNRLTAKVIEAGLQGWAEFNRRYLGASATAPTMDAMGFPLQAGAIYYDLNTDNLFVYTPDGWVKWSPTGEVQTGIPPGGVAGNVLTRNQTGQIEWRPVVDQSARDAAQTATTAATTAQAAATAAATAAADKLATSGGTVTGQIYLREPPDAAGNRTSSFNIDKNGPVGRAWLHFTENTQRRRSIVLGNATDAALGPNLGVATWRGDGTLETFKQLVLAGDAFPSTGGTVAGLLHVNGDALFRSGARVKEQLQVFREHPEFGGEILFIGPTGNYSVVNDIYQRIFRWWVVGDNRTLAQFDLDTGMFHVWSAAGMRANRLTSVGDVVYGGALVSTSDLRTKEDISSIEDPMWAVRRLQGVNYRKREGDNGRLRIGFIAQDVQAVVPQVVDTGLDDMLGINYAALTALHNEALKELDRRLARVEGRLPGEPAWR